MTSRAPAEELFSMHGVGADGGQYTDVTPYFASLTHAVNRARAVGNERVVIVTVPHDAVYNGKPLNDGQLINFGHHDSLIGASEMSDRNWHPLYIASGIAAAALIAGLIGYLARRNPTSPASIAFAPRVGAYGGY